MSELELKERLIYSLFLDMMKESGHDVKKLDYEERFQQLAKVNNVEYKDYIKDIKEHNHDFLLFKETPILMQVFFSNKKVSPKNYDFPESLGGALLIFITPFHPFFQISLVKNFCSKGMLRPLHSSKILPVPAEAIDKYSKMIFDRFR